MVRADGDEYSFAQIVFLFQLIVPGGNAWTENYASVQRFDVTEPVDEVDLVINFVCLQLATKDGTDASTSFNLHSTDNAKIEE